MGSIPQQTLSYLRSLPPAALMQLAEKRISQLAQAKATATPPTLHEWIAGVTIEDPQRTPSILPFDLWPAQRDALDELEHHKRVIFLKARQLGVTWLVLARALHRCLYRSNQTIIVISKDQPAAGEMIRRARGMFMRLAVKPQALAIDNVGEVAWDNESRIKAFASSSDAGSAFTGSLLILDELAKNANADDIWTAAQPTINDGGEVVIISTAKGRDNLYHRLWQRAEAGESGLHPIFIPWHARPGRDAEWYARTASDAVSMAHHMQEYPATPDEAFQALAESPFLPSMTWWDACAESLPALTANEPMVVALDAAVSGDSFGLVAVTRHPLRAGDIAVRHVQAWRPPAGGMIDYGAPGGPEQVLRALVDSWNVVQVTYDPYQLHDMMTRLRNEGRVYVDDFGQQSERLEADAALRQMIMHRRIAHPGDAVLTEHVGNADAKIDTDGRRLRIVKREQSLKIDAAVALSMAAYRCAKLAL
jgi:hypothetical protein